MGPENGYYSMISEAASSNDPARLKEALPIAVNVIEKFHERHGAPPTDIEQLKNAALKEDRTVAQIAETVITAVILLTPPEPMVNTIFDRNRM